MILSIKQMVKNMHSIRIRFIRLITKINITMNIHNKHIDSEKYIINPIEHAIQTKDIAIIQQIISIKHLNIVITIAENIIHSDNSI